MDLEIPPLWIYTEEIDKKKFKMFILALIIKIKDKLNIQNRGYVLYKEDTHNVY